MPSVSCSLLALLLCVLLLHTVCCSAPIVPAELSAVAARLSSRFVSMSALSPRRFSLHQLPPVGAPIIGPPGPGPLIGGVGAGIPFVGKKPSSPWPWPLW
jgi:hypothetical protein